MYRARFNHHLRQIEEAQALALGHHFMGGGDGTLDKQDELLDGETRLGKHGMPHHQARQVVIYDVEKHLEGRVLHVEPTEFGHQRQQGRGANFQLGGEQQPLLLDEDAALLNALHGLQGDDVDAMALIADIMFNASLLQPTHYHFGAGCIHHDVSKLWIARGAV